MGPSQHQSTEAAELVSGLTTEMNIMAALALILATEELSAVTENADSAVQINGNSFTPPQTTLTKVMEEFGSRVIHHWLCSLVTWSWRLQNSKHNIGCV